MKAQSKAKTRKQKNTAGNTESNSDSPKSDVTDVTVLQASDGAGLSGNTDENADVTRVTDAIDSDDEADAGFADACAPGFPDLENRPQWACYSSLDEWPRNGGKTRKPGVYFHTFEDTKDGPVKVDNWLCTALFVDAIASDGAGREFGRLLIIEDRFKNKKQWCMPMGMLAGSCEDLRRELLGMGWEVDQKTRSRLPDYLFSQHPKKRVRAVGQVGWSDGRKSFVTPVSVIGDESVFYQSAHPGTGDYATGGTLESWKHEVALPAIGNPVLIVSISLALGGPLMDFFDVQGGGVHFYHDSSCGKSTAADVACSVYGTPDKFRKTWLATGNGLEGISALRNDTCLVLDEISEANPHTVGGIVYAICNGAGKQRANRSGNAAESKRWRLMLLSTGEKALETIMGGAGIKTNAGQEIRLPSICVARAHGAFDNLHHFQDGAVFSDHLQAASRKHYGHAGMAFIKALMESPPVTSDFREIEAGFKTDHGQTTRVGKRFALIAYAGELAIAFGILPWEPGTAIEAAMTLFQAWLSGQRTGNHEQEAILAALREYLEVHGESRFTSMKSVGTDAERLSNSARSGWFDSDPEKGKGYRMTAAGLKHAAPGFDKRRVLRALVDAGIWDATTKRAEQERVPVEGNVRLWPPIYLEGLQDEA